MVKLLVHGRRIEATRSELGRALPPGRIRVKGTVEVEAARAGLEPQVFEGLQPDDVVEIELQDGLRIWSRVEDLPADLAGPRQRSQATDAIEIPSTLEIGPASRSVGGWAVKALSVLGIDIAGSITDFVAESVEGHLSPGPGLFRCSLDSPANLAPPEIRGDGPVMLFLHGTASSTQGSFGQLWNPDAGAPIRSLFTFYGARILAFQHQSLTRSPIENAVDLVKALQAFLPVGAELHIVSHSRGGLIGELIALGMRVGSAPVTPEDLAIFGAGRKKDQDGLRDLSKRLQQFKPRVTKFVRVACPARGTTLADGRLDRYFSVLVNLASFIPVFGDNVLYDALTSLLAGVLKKRTEPTELPGLEAMMPTSPLVRMLNQPGVQTGADLHVLGGDLAGTGLFGRLKTLATDVYYRDDHDLVVNTPAMLGGLERKTPVPYWIDTGNEVTHFNYFLRQDTSRRLVAALTGSSVEFRRLEAKPSAVTSKDYVKRAGISRPVVFVLPGIMGSELALDGRRVWVDLLALARGGLPRLGPAAGVKATGLVADGYAALCEHLANTHEVMPFPYDWRRPIAESAEALRKELEKTLDLAEAAGQPVRLLAHSMGGLVVRAMLATESGRAAWARACQHAGARFIMLGTPNGGSHAIAAMLMGRDALVRKLALVDLRSSHAELLATITGFEGALSLLPYTATTRDYLDPKTWAELLQLDAPDDRGLFGKGSVATDKSAGFRWTLPDAAMLGRVRAFADLIGKSPLDPARTIYVAGVAAETACDIVPDKDAKEGRKVKVLASARGDGRVLWVTGIPQGIPAFYAEASHGDLASDRRHFAALVDLLETGGTTRLPSTAPIGRASDDVFEMREPLAAMVPGETELIAAALGGSHARLQETLDDATKVHVRVLHDDLSNARAPVLVSHYRHDVIVAAEKYLDNCLGGRLSELLRMELYPGPINTGVVVMNELASADDLSMHPGAIVAGLGEVGELTPGKLVSTLECALTLYGADCVGRERRRQQRSYGAAGGSGTIFVSVASILIGSGVGGLTLQDSVRALLRAVIQANHRLRSARGNGREGLIAQIDRLDIVELYEDRAIEALHYLNTVAAAPEFGDYVAAPWLVAGHGGQLRARHEQAASWWQRLRIGQNDEGQLEFEAVTQTARTPARPVSVRSGTVNCFIEDAMRTTTYDPRLGRTLFDLLVPHDFKPYASDRLKLALLLDPAAAPFPWELLEDRTDRSAEPLAVGSGLVRQLRVENEREQVLRAPGETALVIGNPKVTDPRFPPLAGAEAEAALVTELLGTHGYAVTPLINDSASLRAVLSAIHEKPWRILHLAAHGVFEFDAGKDRKVSGLVLDKNEYFTAADAQQMRYVPELVFINCCHLGQMKGDAAPDVRFHELAANLATQFIKMGSRGVVAAGWAVNDRAAKTFAASFYRHMLKGWLYGDAVRQARQDTYSKHGQTNTWGAYQCYGDPSFSLKAGGAPGPDEAFVSPSELRVWLDGVTKRAASVSDTATLLSEVTRQIDGMPAAWWADAALCAQAAQAYFELRDFERASVYFSRVLSAVPASAPMRAYEQQANCKVRWAWDVARTDRKKAMALLDEAATLIEHLLGIGETSERYALRAGLHKRRAMLATSAAASRKAVTAMTKDYRTAFQLSVDGGAPDAYPLVNLLAGEVALSWGPKGKAHLKEAKALIATVEEVAKTLAATRTDPFNLSAGADRLFYQALLSRRISSNAEQGIQDRLAAAVARGASPRVRDSLRSQIEFLLAVADRLFPAKDREHLKQALGRLRK
ncbi:MAG: CHAT domain-containing protein [Vicinamibacteraceae bacterium]